MTVRSVIQSVTQSVVSPVTNKFGVGAAAEFIKNNAIVDLDGLGIASASGVITEWTNSGTGGSAFDLDVPLGTQANMKPHPSGSALFYGASGDYISTPDSAAASVTGSAIFYGLIKPTDSTPGGLRTIVSKWTESGNLRSYRFSLDNSPSGGLQLNLSSNGAINEAIDATEGTGFANDTVYWTFAAYNASVPELVFRTLEGNEGLTPAAAFALSNKLGDSVPCVATSIDDNSSAFEVGSINVGVSGTFPGAIFKAGIISGTDPTATPAVSFNAKDGGNKTGVASDTFFGTETLTPSERTVNATDWNQSGTGTLTLGSEFTLLDDTDVDSDQTRWQLSLGESCENGQAFKTKVILLQGTALVSSVRVRFSGGIAFSSQVNYNWSTGVLVASAGSPTDLSAVTNSDGTVTLSFVSANDSSGNTLARLGIYPASSSISFTGSCSVKNGSASFENAWTMHGNTFIQNTGHTSINSIGSAGLESTAGQTISGAMTIFMIGKLNALTGSAQFFSAAKSLASSSPQIQTSGTDFFRFNAGSSLTAGEGDTDLHLHTVRYNQDSTTNYTVDGIGSITGNAGSENYEWGTLFASISAASTLNGSISQYIIIPFATTDAQTESIEAFLLSKFGL